MQRSLICTILFGLFVTLSFGQANDKSALAQKYAQRGREAIAQQKVDEGIKLMGLACKMAPNNLDYRIELAQTCYYARKYKRAANLCIKMLKGRKKRPIMYQILGNSYDGLDKPGRAKSTFQDGIKAFPDAAPLYMEMGITCFAEEKDEQALSWWERGIAANPWFSSNYFFAARSHFLAGNRVWAAIYAENCMNIERQGPRLEEMSKLLFACFEESWDPGTQSFTFWEPRPVRLESTPTKSELFEDAWAAWYNAAVPDSMTEISLNSVIAVRDSAIQHVLRDKKVFKQVPLLGWYEKLDELEVLPAYQMWLFFDARKEEFAEWYKENQAEYDPFEDWFLENSFRNYLKRATYRLQFKDGK